MEIRLHRHLVWTVVDATVWQPSVPQFSAPASLEVGRNTRDVSDGSRVDNCQNVARDPYEEAPCWRPEVVLRDTHTHTHSACRR